ncbi:efflux transporter outer membrane subunit [Noviherbaspirillum sp. ST9]|uniref:efflux transporter outer membrane subunit n=1 Tax=Noviherbaspirillum sp. ST9 TaxID=3401606 RepID=UPI003B586CB8
MSRVLCRGKRKTAAAIIGLALAATTLAGCAVKRDRYDVPAIPVPVTFPKAASAPDADDKPADSSPVAIDQALPQWWRLLGSAELNRLVDRALSGNHDLRIANLRIRQAAARAKQAVSDQLPTLTAPLQAKREAPPGGIGTVGAGGDVKSRDVYQLGLRGDWRMDVWGERAALSESADLQLWRAVFQRDDVQRTVIANVVSSYIDYLSFTDRMAVARETDAAVSDMLSTITARLEKGDATVIDMEQQRAAVYAVKATIPALQQQRDEALNNLSFLIGAPPGSLKLSGNGLASLSFPAVDPGVPSSLLLRRPDIRVMEARLLAADADLDVARARLMPPLDLSAQAGFGTPFVSQMFESHTLFWNLIGNLSATIFDYGKRDREVDFARAMHEELVETYARVIYTGIREVDDALNAIALTRQRLEAQRESAEAARRSWEYSRESYQAGSVDHLLMLDAERTYQRNLDEQHNVDRLRYRALASLFASLGGGLQTEGPLPGKGERPSAPAGAATAFAVEIGRAGSRQEAATLAETWKDKGYATFVVPVTDEDGLPGYAVYFGRLASEDQAAMMARAFNEQEGRPARTVRLGPSPGTGGNRNQ